MYGCRPPFAFDPVTQRAVPSWTEAQQAALDAGKGTEGSHTDRDIRSFGPTIRALANLLSPAVVDVEPTDQAAGDLSRVIGTAPDGSPVVKTFDADFIDLAEDTEGLPIIVAGIQKDWTMHDLLSLFYELDEQARIGSAVAVNAPTFAELSAADQATLWGLLQGPLQQPPAAGLPEPLLTIGVPAATMSQWYRLTQRLMSQLIVEGNYPYVEHTTSRTGVGPSGPRMSTANSGGFGDTSQVRLTNASEGISRPGGAGAGSFAKFVDGDYPEQPELRDLRQLAMIQANATAINPETGNAYHVDSEAAFQQLLALKAARGVRDYTG